MYSVQNNLPRLLQMNCLVTLLMKNYIKSCHKIDFDQNFQSEIFSSLNDTLVIIETKNVKGAMDSLATPFIVRNNTFVNMYRCVHHA